MKINFCLGINSLGMRFNIKPIYVYYYYYFKCVFASNPQKFLVPWLGAITICLKVIVLRV